MLKVLGNRLYPYNKIEIDIFEASEDGSDLGIVGETRKFEYKKTIKLECEVLTEQLLKNYRLIDAELLKIDVQQDGSVILLVLI